MRLVSIYLLLSITFLAGQARSEENNIYRLYSLQTQIHLHEEKINRLVKGARYKNKEHWQAKIDREEQLLKHLYLAYDKGKNLLKENSLSQEPTINYFQMEEPWRLHVKNINIIDLHHYEAHREKVIELPTDTYRIEVNLHDRYHSKSNHKENEREIHQPGFSARVECEGPYEVSRMNKTPAGFWWHPKRKLQLVLTPDTKSCLLRFQEKNSLKPNNKIYSIRLVVPPKKDVNLQNNFSLCSLPRPPKEESPLRQFFLSPQYTSYTCPLSLPEGKWSLLSSSTNAMNAKVRLLLGTDLPQEMLDQEDLNYPLDFSQAPQLKTITIATLSFHDSFSGRVMKRLLDYHAEQGTKIYLLTMNSILPSENKFIRRLGQSYGNFQSHLYKYNNKDFYLGLKLGLSQIHRTNHIKIFATLPVEGPASVILGGRNIGDQYFFESLPPGHKPKKHFYFFKDLDILIQDDDIAKSIMSQFFTVWNYDRKSYALRDVGIHVPNNQDLDPNYFSPDKTYIRHIVSSPYTDSKQLEKFYIKLINSAQFSLNIVTPYLSMTPAIRKAIINAAKRNVSVKIIVRTNLKGDAFGSSVVALFTKQEINRLFDKLEIFDYRPKHSILHSKIILVDGELSIIGSINLNKRSFFHDLENTVVAWSPSLHKDAMAIFESYLANSERIQKKIKTGGIKNTWLRFIKWIAPNDAF